MGASARLGSRTPRAGLLAGLSVALAAAAHRLGQGIAPDWRVTLLAWGVLTALLTIVSAIRPSRAPLSATSAVVGMVAVQIGLHLVFAVWPAGVGGPDLAHLLCARKGADTRAAAAVLRANGLLRTPAPRPAALGPLMLAAHLLAAVLTAAWLRRVDLAVGAALRLPAARTRLAALRRLASASAALRRAARLLAPPEPLLPSAAHATLAAALTPAQGRRRGRDVLGSIARRGPPALTPQSLGRPAWFAA